MKKLFSALLILSLFTAGAALANPGAGPVGPPAPSAPAAPSTASTAAPAAASNSGFQAGINNQSPSMPGDKASDQRPSPDSSAFTQ